MSAVPLERLAEVLVEVADTLVDDFDLVEFLQTLAAHTVELVDVQAAGLLLTDGRGELHFMAASDEATRLLELYQVQNHEGPCLDAVRTRAAVVNADLREASERWPVFAPRAAALGFVSVHAIPLRYRNEVIGALNLFGDAPGRLGEDEVRLVQALADIATIGLLQERSVRRAQVLTEQLQGALNSRVVIEQAKGALARWRSVGVDEAFELMREHADRHGLKLGDVARAVVTAPSTVRDLTGA